MSDGPSDARREMDDDGGWSISGARPRSLDRPPCSADLGSVEIPPMSEIDQLRMAAMANADAAKMAEMELEHEKRMNGLLHKRIAELENKLSRAHADHACDDHGF